MTSDNQDDHAEDARRSCPQYATRMSSLIYDKHSVCSSYRKSDCSYDIKCVECILWPDEDFAKYIKHKKSLDYKSRNCKSKKSEDGLARSSSGDSVVSPSRAGNLSSGASIDEARVLEIISSQFNVLAQSLASSMENSFV